MISKLFILIIIFISTNFAQLLNPKLVTQQTKYDFGDINQGEKVSHVFILYNNGGDLLVINDVKATCGCTAAIPEKNEIAPGESTNLNVTFNSAGRKGKQLKNIFVSSNDPETPEVVLTITANVIFDETTISEAPTIYFPETEHNFGKVDEGKVVEYTFKFVNNGKATLKIKDIKTSCGCTAALVSNELIEPGSDGTLKIELNTKNRNGKMSRTITVNSNDPKEPKKVLTVYADVVKKG